MSNQPTNLTAFLDMIAYSEIGEKLLKNSDDGYNVIVGGSLFSDYANHPSKRVYLPKYKIYSTAAGRYQILLRYWKYYKKQLGLKDFGHRSQDAVAIQLIKECHALEDIYIGRFETAVQKCSSRWASLPHSGYGQHENKLDDLKLAYLAAGGILNVDVARV